MENDNRQMLDMMAKIQGFVMHGRTMITTAEKEITQENLPKIMQDAISTHDFNVWEINYLYNYFRGFHPILMRHKAIRPEINNKTPENHAYEAVKFKLSYEFSYPVQYVSIGGTDKSELVDSLERFMRSENKFTDDGEIAQWMYICGQGYRLCLPIQKGEISEAPFHLAHPDPRNAFVIYSADVYHEPMAGVVITTNADNETVYTIYTPTMRYEYINGAVTNSKSIIVGYVPLIEYPLNPERMGVFEPVLPLFDAIDTLNSNALDGVEQVIQSIVAFINVSVDQSQLDEAAKNGAICLKGTPGLPADVKTLAEKVSQSELDETKDRFYRMALTIMGIPDRAQQTSGGDTGEAVALRNGWSVAEARALMTERFWNESENRFLKLAIRLCQVLAPDSVKGLTSADINVKFTRNLSDNLLVKTQGLQNLKNCGINKEMAIQSVGLFSDPHAVAVASTAWDEMAASASQTPTNNLPGDGAGGDGANGQVQA